MSNINKQALRIPERKKHNWGQAVMRDCDFCQQWALTVQHADGGCICASCCDSEYTSDLKVTLAAALEQLEAAEKTSDARKQGLIRAHKMFQREKARAEAAEKRIAELEAREVKLPKPHAHLIWIQAGYAPDDYWDDVAVSHSEKEKCCDGSDRYPVYAPWEIEEALTAAGISIKGE